MIFIDMVQFDLLNKREKLLLHSLQCYIPIMLPYMLDIIFYLECGPSKDIGKWNEITEKHRLIVSSHEDGKNK